MARTQNVCRALRLSRSSYYCSGRSSVESRRICKEVLEFEREHPRYGYRCRSRLILRIAFW